MKKAAYLDPEKCIRDRFCQAANACPVGALTQNKRGELPQVAKEACIACGRCVMTCPERALKMKQIEA